MNYLPTLLEKGIAIPSRAHLRITLLVAIPKQQLLEQ